MIPLLKLAHICRHRDALFLVVNSYGCDIRHKSKCLFGDYVLDFHGGKTIMLHKNNK